MAVNNQYERTALTPPREVMHPGGGGEMRGVVIISMPRTDSEGKTLCAAFAVQGQQGHQQQLLQQQQQQAQSQYQQQLTVVSSAAAAAGASLSAMPMRRLRRRQRFKRFSLCAIVVAAAIFLWLRGPLLMTTNTEEQQEDEDKQVHVYTLYPKYAPVRTKMVQMRRTLLERDMQRLGRVATSNGNATAMVPIRGNIYPDGLYYMALLVGRPAKLYFLDMDTGSDLTWLQCDAPCRSCAPGPHGLYDPRKAELVDCRLPVCSHVQSGSSYSCTGGVHQCDYDVEYADGSSTMGVLMQDVITLMLTNGTLTQRKAVLGCGYDQQGALAQSPASTDGVLGLSNSKVALSSQLAEQGIINNVIGHCLAGGSNGGGYLFFGDELVPSWGMTWTPLLGRPVMENYQTHLYSIRYGGDKVEMDGNELSGLNSGIIFDSGTSFTYLVPEVYRPLLSVIQEQATRSGLVRVESDDTLPFCWGGASPFQSVSDVSRYFKSVTLDFGGSNWFSTGRTMDLTPDGYLIISTQGNVCLGILDASGASVEATNIVGDISMRGYLVVYDNVQQRIGWIRRNCHIRPTRTTNQFPSLFN